LMANLSFERGSRRGLGADRNRKSLRIGLHLGRICILSVVGGTDDESVF